jgi:hypothetical protein
MLQCSTVFIITSLFLMAGCEAPENLTAFVRVSEDGLRFEVNGAPFYFAGANCYYLMVSCPRIRAIWYGIGSAPHLLHCCPLCAHCISSKS